MTVIDSALKSTALALVDRRSSMLDATSHKACADFFDHNRTADLWQLSIEAIGDLAELRHRLEHDIPLAPLQREMLMNLTEVTVDTVEVCSLRGVLQNPE